MLSSNGPNTNSTFSTSNNSTSFSTLVNENEKIKELNNNTFKQNFFMESKSKYFY